MYVLARSRSGLSFARPLLRLPISKWRLLRCVLSVHSSRPSPISVPERVTKAYLNRARVLPALSILLLIVGAALGNPGLQLPPFGWSRMELSRYICSSIDSVSFLLLRKRYASDRRAFLMEQPHTISSNDRNHCQRNKSVHLIQGGEIAGLPY